MIEFCLHVRCQKEEKVKMNEMASRILFGNGSPEKYGD